MKRLLSIEWIKLRHYKPFWILSSLYFIGLLLTFLGGQFFLMWIDSEGVVFRGIKATMLPIYDFDDIWHNFTYLASLVRVVPALIFLIMVTNEYSYKTLRQNIIDGMSRSEFLHSKLLLALVYSLASMLFIFLSGLIIGLIYSPVKDFDSIFGRADFLLGHGMEMFAFFSFTLFLSILIRRTGFALVLLLIYSIMLEPLLALYIGYKMDGPEIFFPIKSINLLVENPFAKYILLETQDHVKLGSVAIVLVWTLLFNYGSYLILRKRDLL
jgi:ABC-type transport system involved in multi-copper enzyme maturation permease subunit